jgi:hypothetical protein
VAISVTNLISTGTATDALSYAMPSANYDANALILFTMANSRVSSPSTTITITGLTGATWDLVTNFLFNTTAAPGINHSVFRTMIGTSQNAATITASFGGTTTQTGFVGAVDVVTGCATSGSNGVNALAQVGSYFSTVGVTSLSIGLASTPTNAVYGAWSKSVASTMGTPTGFTGLANLSAATPSKGLMTCWNLTPTTTFTSTQPAGASIVGVALEFRPQSVGGATVQYTRRLLVGVGR